MNNFNEIIEIFKKIYYKLLEVFAPQIALFNSVDWAEVFLPIKIISAFLSLGFIVIIAYLIYLIRDDIKNFLATLIDRTGDSEEPEKISIEGWQSVLDKMASGDEANLKLAVIEADKLFDDLLKRSNYQGTDMGERLRQVTLEQLPNLDEVWQAHKMRNRLVHEPDFQLRDHEAERIIEIYQKAFQNLEAL